MIRFIKRLLGCEEPSPSHVCEEFTQWQIGEHRYFDRDDIEKHGANVSTETIPAKVVRYQQRRCTLCGKIQQEHLDY